MRRHLYIIFLLVFVALNTQAWEYQSIADSTVQSAQMRVGFNWNKKWDNGLRLHLGEELRFDMYNTATGAGFNRSYTTLTLAYAPVQYVKIDAGYTLKIYGTKDWSDYNEWLRHRVFFSVTGSYKWDLLKLSLRERAMCELRTDSVNQLEKNQYGWFLRSRLSAEFYVPGKPVKPYAWVEMTNTLNAPEYQQYYKDNNPANGGHQFICQVRTQAGVKWRVAKHSTLDFYYRFAWGNDRDINVTKKKQYIELTEKTTFRHSIGISYDLDW